MAVRRDILMRINAVLLEQLNDLFRRVESAIFQKLRPFYVNSMGDVAVALAARRSMLASPFNIIAHVDECKGASAGAARDFVDRRTASRGYGYLDFPLWHGF